MNLFNNMLASKDELVLFKYMLDQYTDDCSNRNNAINHDPKMVVHLATGRVLKGD